MLQACSDKDKILFDVAMTSLKNPTWNLVLLLKRLKLIHELMFYIEDTDIIMIYRLGHVA